jgi:hypothetical protein
MPTPDASQFIQFKKFQAIQKRGLVPTPKSITHLYQPVPTASAVTDFLASFSTKYTPNLLIAVRPNYNTAPKVKTGATPQINV